MSRRDRKRKELQLRRRAPVGTAPGTLVVDPQSPAPIIGVIAFGPDGVDERTVSDVRSVAPCIGKHPVTWINVDGLGDAGVIQALGEMFNLHRLALEDVMNVHQRAKVEPYGQHLFVVARMVNIGEHVETEQLSMFVGKSFLVTFQERHGDCFDPVRDRIRQGRGRIRGAGPDYLAYALLDGVVDAYFPMLERLGERLELLELEVLDKPRTRTVKQIHDVKRELLTLRRAIWPMREACNTLIRDPSVLVADETRLYFRDVYDHAIQIIDLVETFREIGSGLTEIYLSSLSQRMNEVVKVLTIISTIFIPLTFVAGVYGMNFDTSVSRWNMPELKWEYGYPVCLLAMALLALAMLLYFRRRGWIGQGKDERDDCGE